MSHPAIFGQQLYLTYLTAPLPLGPHGYLVLGRVKTCRSRWDAMSRSGIWSLPPELRPRSQVYAQRARGCYAEALPERLGPNDARRRRDGNQMGASDNDFCWHFPTWQLCSFTNDRARERERYGAPVDTGATHGNPMLKQLCACPWFLDGPGAGPL